LGRAEPEPPEPAGAARPLAVPVFAPPAVDPVRAPLPAVLAAPDPETALAAPDPEAALAAPDPEAALAAPDPAEAEEPERGRSELWVARTGPPVVAPASAPAAPAGSVVQFLNMKNCWPSVHRLVVTQ
jgi:hypothetical protein